MRINLSSRQERLSILLLIFFVAVFFFLFYDLQPPALAGSEETFLVKTNDGFREIADNLYSQGLIRSAPVFEVFSLLTGQASELRPGIYQLNSNQTAEQILSVLAKGPKEVKVTIPDDSSVVRIDNILSKNGIIRAGALIGFSRNHAVEGQLYPDTYDFFQGEPVEEIISQFLADFHLKAMPILGAEPKQLENNLILASLISKEAPDPKDQQLIAGIFKKRLGMGMPLQVDASICYAKEKISSADGSNDENCYPLTAPDFKIDSPYNTYSHSGLPPTPIGSPNISAIEAAMNPIPSPYLFYISDLISGRTVYAKTLAEQNVNIEIYLRKNLK